jgi:hypothetical protein
MEAKVNPKYAGGLTTRAWYGASIAGFLQTQPDTIIVLAPEQNHAKIAGFYHAKIGSGNTSAGSFIGSLRAG